MSTCFRRSVFASTGRLTLAAAAAFAAATPVVAVSAIVPAVASAAATASISKLDPNEVFTVGNDLVFVEGSGLSTVTGITVDGTPVDFADEGDGTLSFFTPAHAAGKAQVRLVTAGGITADSGTVDDLNYVTPPPVPVITSITPNFGPVAGGNTVTIKGSNLGGVLGVVFGDFALAENLVVKSATEVTVTAPPGAGTGKVDLLVINAGGSNENTATDDYFYGTAPTTPVVTTPRSTTPKPTTPATTTPKPTTPKPTTPVTTTPKSTTPATTTPKPTTPSATTPGSKLTLTYQCTYPLIGEAPLKVDFDAAIPSTVGVGKETGEFNLSSVITASGKTYDGMSLIGAVKIQGTATTKSTVTTPSGVKLPASVPSAIATYNVPPTKQDLVFTANGSFPSLIFPSAGKATITVDSIALSLKALKADGTPVIFPGSGEDSDKDASTFDVTCRLDPASQSTLLHTLYVGTTPPTTPSGTSPKPTTPAGTTPGGTTPGGTTPKPGDTTAPVVTITGFTQTGATASAAFKLSEGAKVTATLSQLRPGVLFGTNCVAVPGGVAVPNCLKRVYAKPSPTAWFNKGERSIVFSAVPKPGDYSLTLVAIDAAGNRGWVSQTVTIV